MRTASKVSSLCGGSEDGKGRQGGGGGKRGQSGEGGGGDQSGEGGQGVYCLLAIRWPMWFC